MRDDRIPIIDLFAGPGGLGEGFSSDLSEGRPFRIAVSVEKDQHAHDTLSLRAFYRHFLHEGQKVPNEYYRHLAEKISRDELERLFPKVWAKVRKEALCAELGNPEKDHQPLIDKRITAALKGKKNWLLIGGPPCQAYSLVGRARMQNATDYREKQGHTFDEDSRHKLYRQYLRIIAKHSPAVFVMENVKGILSSKLNGEKIFPKILNDLKDPYKAGTQYGWERMKKGRYHIVSFVTGTEPKVLTDYLIRSENYGIPQMRHRVILLGIRDDIWKAMNEEVRSLKQQEEVKVRQVIESIPKLRGGFSKGDDSAERWSRFFKSLTGESWFKELPKDIKGEVRNACRSNAKHAFGRNYDGKYMTGASKHATWFADGQLINLPNHTTRTHMDSDLARYLFVAAYGEANGTSPRLKDFPVELLPKHKNVQEGIKTGKFADRFKVQLWDQPASTITSHISKDGHYFIHPDPAQCRSLTVREAARIQTFPDNYYFEGGRTQQYHQVGNAVPPLLAKQLAEVVWDIFKRV